MMQAYINNFPFLHQRFSHGFFCKFLNYYLLFIFEIAERHHLDTGEVAGGLVGLLYSDQIKELDHYKDSYLDHIVYGGHDHKEESEIYFLQSDDKFVLGFVHAFLSQKSIKTEKIQQELFRLSGLLIINRLPHLKRDRGKRPRILIPGGLSIRFSTPYILQTTINEYQKEYRYAAKLSDSFAISGRPSYVALAKEFLEFSDLFLLHYKKFLTDQLGATLRHYYSGFQLGRHGAA